VKFTGYTVAFHSTAEVDIYTGTVSLSAIIPLTGGGDPKVIEKQTCKIPLQITYTDHSKSIFIYSYAFY
jgi:hypothetical protein